MSEKVVLELTREHAQIVQDACEMLMRMRLGQSGFVTDLMLGWPMHEGMSIDEFCIRREAANDVMTGYLKCVLGLNNYGLPNGRKDELEARAYEVWATLRHTLFLHDYKDASDRTYDVRGHEPLNESGLEMPKCKVVETK